MKHYLHFAAVAALAVLVAGAAVSCSKDTSGAGNPPVDQSLVATPFTLSAIEDRGASGKLEWVVGKNGTTDSVSEELDVMTVTSVNSFTFTAKPESSSGTFPGVNVRSSNTSVVMPTVVSGKEFTLKYVGDGEATIKVWNGNENGGTSIEFGVVARSLVYPEALRFIVDGKIVDVTGYDTEKEAIAHRVPILTLPAEEYFEDFDDITVVHKIVFMGLAPENCSFDKVDIQPGMEYRENWKNWLIEHEYNQKEFFPEVYKNGGALSSLKGKVCYHAYRMGCYIIAPSRLEDGVDANYYPPQQTCFKAYVRRNPSLTKHYACYVRVPDL